MPTWFDQEVLGNPVLSYFLFLWVIFGVFIGYLIVLKLLKSRWLKRFSSQQPQLHESLTALMKKPLRWVSITLVVWVGAEMFKLPDEAQILIQSALLGLIALSVSYVMLKLIDVCFVHLQSKTASTETKLDDQLYPILSKATKVFIVVITGLLVVQNWGYDITPLLAGLGIGGLALALAAQDTVANLFGAMTIFVDQPFHIGDSVNLEGYSGTIENIGLRSTRLRTFEGTLVTLPNSLMTKAKVENTSDRLARRTNFTIGVTYDTSHEKLQLAVDVLREVIGNHPSTDKSRVYFSSYGDFSLNIQVQHWSKLFADYAEYIKILEAMNFEIKRRFEAAGIEMAFPTQTVYLHPDQPAVSK